MEIKMYFTIKKQKMTNLIDSDGIDRRTKDNIRKR